MAISAGVKTGAGDWQGCGRGRGQEMDPMDQWIRATAWQEFRHTKCAFYSQM